MESNIDKKESGIKTITVFGSGVLGSQILVQSVLKGFNVKCWCRSEDSISRAKDRISKLVPKYIKIIDFMNTPEGKSPLNFCRGIYPDPKTYSDTISKKLKENLQNINITYLTDIQKATENSDIIIETIEEKLETKQNLFNQINNFIQPNQIICTNSSTILPSILCKSFTNPKNFLGFHLANLIYKNNIAEIMGHAETDKTVVDKVALFAKDLGLFPVIIKKEIQGYLLNSMLIPFLFSGLKLWAYEISDPKTIDDTWKISTGAPYGPLEICDIVGFNSIYNVLGLQLLKDPDNKDTAVIRNKIKEEIDKGNYGLENKKGFYNY